MLDRRATLGRNHARTWVRGTSLLSGQEKWLLGTFLGIAATLFAFLLGLTLWLVLALSRHG